MTEPNVVPLAIFAVGLAIIAMGAILYAIYSPWHRDLMVTRFRVRHGRFPYSDEELDQWIEGGQQ